MNSIKDIIKKNKLIKVVDTNAESYTTPENITSISSTAFKDTNFKSITITDNVNDFDEIALSGLPIEKIVFPNNLTSLNYGICMNCNNLKDITLPSKLQYLSEHSFSSCFSLDTVNLPKDLKVIEQCAFYLCSNLKYINLPDSIEKIEDSVFSDCVNLEKITFPDNIKSIGHEAFHYCRSLKNITLPKNLEDLGASAFSDCENLQTVMMPKNLKEIKNYAFQNCKNLHTISLPENLESIEAFAFADCENLKEIKFPKSLHVISLNAFQNAGIEKITIPENVTEISNGAFANCKKLQKVIITSNFLKDIGPYTFDKCKKLTEIDVIDTNDRLYKTLKEKYPNINVYKVNKTIINVENHDKAAIKKFNSKENFFGVKIEEKPMSTSEQIDYYIDNNKSFMLHGRSGIGKTRRIEEKDPDFVSIVLRNGILPEEVIGKTIFPNGIKDENSTKGIWIPPVWYSTLIEKCEKEQNKNHVLFIDELTNVKPNEQSLVFNLILTRSIGPNFGKLPKNCVVVAAGNDILESESAYNMPEPLFRRFIGHIYLNPSIKDFIDWGLEPKKDKPEEQKIHPLILNYVACYDEKVLFSNYDNEFPPKYTLDPRGWEQISDIIYNNDGEISKELLVNKIGIENAENLIAFASISPITVQSVLNNTFDKENLPKSKIGKYLTTLSLKNVDEFNVKKVRDFIKTNLGKENLSIFDSEWIKNDEEKAIFINGLDKSTKEQTF